MNYKFSVVVVNVWTQPNLAYVSTRVSEKYGISGVYSLCDGYLLDIGTLLTVTRSSG